SMAWAHTQEPTRTGKAVCTKRRIRVSPAIRTVKKHPLVLQSHLREKCGKLSPREETDDHRRTKRTSNESRREGAAPDQPGGADPRRADRPDRGVLLACGGEKACGPLPAGVARQRGAQEWLADGRGIRRSQRPWGPAAVGRSRLG